MSINVLSCHLSCCFYGIRTGKEHAFPMAMEYHLYLRILMRGGLGILLCFDIPGFHDLDRIDGTSE